MTFAQAAQNNTYIKDHAASGKMIVNYSRNISDFMLPRYVQYKPVPKQTGYYLRIDQRTAGRLVGGSIADFVWPDGQPRPRPRDQGVEFDWQPFTTTRYNYGQPIGDLAVEQASFGLSEIQESALAQKAMRARTLAVQNALNTQANWDSTNWSAVTSISGVSDTWAASLSSNQYIRKSINYAVATILKQTMNAVRKKDLILLMNPNTAQAIAASQELVDVLKQSPVAYDQVKNGTGKFSEYGLPDMLYGCEVVVEDAVYESAERGASADSRSFIMPDAAAFLLSRPGGIVSAAGGPSFSTATLFLKEEMTVERQKDQMNRLQNIDVVDDFGLGLTAPAAGFAFRSVT